MTIQTNPLVSVIIAFLNEERFLPEAIESVMQQKYANWELILVDDGSTDKSSNMALTYARHYPGKIIYCEHEGHSNKGLSASRNAGIAASKGELVAFLDADDVWTADKLQNQVELMQRFPEAAMLCEASEYWNSWHNQDKEDIVIQVGKKQDELFYPPHLLEILYPLSDGAAPCPSGLMVQRSILEKHKGFEAHFTGKYQLYEDQAFLHKIYLNEPVYISSACHNRYRQREGSIVQKVVKEGEYHAVRWYFLTWLQQYVEQKNIHDKIVQRLLKKALQPYTNPIGHFLATAFRPFQHALQKK